MLINQRHLKKDVLLFVGNADESNGAIALN